MKSALIIFLFFVCVNSYGQYSKDYNVNLSYNPQKGWKSPELYLPATILSATFLVNEIQGEKMTEKQRSIIAATGITASLATHFIFRYLREHKNRYKKCNRKRFIY